MTALKVVKPKLLAALTQVVDEPFRSEGFARGKNGLIYKRKLNDSVQEISFASDWYPRYHPGAEAHIYPRFRVMMPEVSKLAIELVRGEVQLLAGVEGAKIIVNQPIEHVAPKGERRQWYATGDEQFVEACESILSFLCKWVLPLLSELSTPGDLVRAYESNDPRITKQIHRYIYIAAAYCELGRIEEAREVVNKQFASLGLRRQYSMVFESLAQMDS